MPLVDSVGTALEQVAMAVGWDAAAIWSEVDGTINAERRVDLNSAAVLFAGDQLVDAVYHEQLGSRDAAISHSGDSPTGEGRGDNEVISLELAQIDPQVTSVILLVTSYSGQSLAQIDNVYYRLLDTMTGTEIARCAIGNGPHTGVVLGKLVRAQPCWHFVGIGAGLYAHHVAEAVPQLAPYLP
ncbi:TerD family protein [Nocardia altamirensis]|uniref:TerD family protein n=1 Tax=Nocardia altamirensis TaxID=472158 RepID=UPI0008400229|nr:TerD family protein [Nocardia altamirensis]